MNLKKYKYRQIILQLIYTKKYVQFFNYFLLLKLIFKNKFIEKQFKVLIIFFLAKFNKKQFKSYQHSICLISGHKRSVFRFFKLNRLHILDILNSSNLPGIEKTI